jgi:hypothetical protein
VVTARWGPSLLKGLLPVRKALNENPVVQIGLLGVLGLVMAVVFMSRMGGGGGAAEEPVTTDPATDPAAASSSTASSTPAAPADSSAAPAASSASGLAPATSPASPATPSPVPAGGGSAPFEAGKGLPSELVSAYESGDTVVLLVVQDKGIEDKPLKREVEALRDHENTTVFVTDAKNVGKYSRVAQGVQLDRVPAIIALKPVGKLAKGEQAPMPEASITYGYMGPGGVEQVLGDARYKGKIRGYDPG